MDLEEKKACLGFSVFEGIGPRRFGLLCQYFGSAQKAYRASLNDLQSTGLPKNLVRSFVSFRRGFNFDSYFLRLRRLGIMAVCMEEEIYPKLLKETDDPPIILYVKAKSLSTITSLFSLRMIGVVGTRKMTSYGREATEMVVDGLVKSGFVIVSGLAYGVDKVAHECTINNSGKTIAVFGTSLEIVYPALHRDLAEGIVKRGGALVSEIPLGGRVNRGTFAARNRIISGLSLGVVVVEAAEQSGSMITASFAAEQGREVFAVPGPINSSLSGGTAALIKKGAKLVSNVADILEEIKL